MSEYEIRLLYSIINNHKNLTLKKILDEFVENKIRFDFKKKLRSFKFIGKN
jgi:hypothetical protein